MRKRWDGRSPRMRQGMRVGASARDDVRVVSMIDYVLVEPKAHDALRPDVALSRARDYAEAIVLLWRRAPSTTAWSGSSLNRHRTADAAYCGVRVESSIGHAAKILEDAGRRSRYDLESKQRASPLPNAPSPSAPR